MKREKKLSYFEDFTGTKGDEVRQKRHSNGLHRLEEKKEF